MRTIVRVIFVTVLACGSGCTTPPDWIDWTLVKSPVNHDNVGLLRSRPPGVTSPGAGHRGRVLLTFPSGPAGPRCRGGALATRSPDPPVAGGTAGS
jgi:hypothetical protein